MRGLIVFLAACVSLSSGFITTGLVRVPCRTRAFRELRGLTVSGEEFEKNLTEWDTPMIVDVFAEWCGPCQVMAPEMEKVAAALEGRCRVFKLDSDEHPEIASALQVYGLPTLLYLKENGVVFRSEGAMPAEAILKIAEEKLFQVEEAEPAA